MSIRKKHTPSLLYSAKSCLIILTLIITLLSCQTRQYEWEGIWHTSIEYISNLESDFEFELSKNMLSGEWSGRWEAVGLFVSGEISKIEINDFEILVDLGDGGIFEGKLSPNKHSLTGVLSGFTLDGNDTLTLVKADSWISEKPALMDAEGNAITSWNYSTPKSRNDGWEVQDLGMGNTVNLLDELFQKVVQGQYRGLDAVLISHNGQLVVEEYFHLGEFDRLHTIQSCTKSVISLLLGIAFDQGIIEALRLPVQSFFPDYLDTLKTSPWPITIEHALTMSAGLDWKEWEVSISSPENDLFLMNNSPDMYSYVLKKNMVKGLKPGVKFDYNSGLSVLLGGIIQHAVKMPVDQFANEFLFEDLGIKNHSWLKLNGIVHTGGGLWLQPRDFLKLGQLVVNNGAWHGKQLISESWIQKSTAFHVSSRARSGYGYQWWTSDLMIDNNKVPLIWAEGLGGQFLFIVPELELVVVFLHHNPDDLDLNHTMAWKELAESIIPAFRSN
ncbi:MAG: serine hydrolase [Saprospiraceae bacterium]|nr:serine hydrolase [Saprospiraceae bacterium]